MDESTQHPMPTKSEHFAKVIDIVIDNLKDTLRAVDRSFLLAVIAAAFVTIHGDQGDFDRDMKEKIEHATKKSSQPGQTDISKKPPSHEVDIPLLGFKTELIDAAVVAMLLYWVFLLRAAFRVQRVGVLASRLRELDQQPVLDVLLLYPSLATANRWTKVLSCLSVGALGWAGYAMWLLPLNQITGKTVPKTLAGAAIIMLPPAAFLCCQLLALRCSTPKTSNAA
jgi:hypothetical protein